MSRTSVPGGSRRPDAAPLTTPPPDARRWFRRAPDASSLAEGAGRLRVLLCCLAVGLARSQDEPYLSPARARAAATRSPPCSVGTQMPPGAKTCVALAMLEGGRSRPPSSRSRATASGRRTSRRRCRCCRTSAGSCCSAPVASVGSVAGRVAVGDGLPVRVDRPAVGRVPGVVPDGDDEVVRGERVVVVAEELARQGVRAGAARIAGRAAVEVAPGADRSAGRRRRAGRLPGTSAAPRWSTATAAGSSCT